jgi:hypothetical protein
MKKYILIIILGLFILPCLAMFDDYEPSVRARGMSGAVTSFSDDYTAILYNPAGLNAAGNQVGATYYQLFGNSFATVSALSGTYQTPYGAFGLGFMSMGVNYLDVNLTTENKFSLGHSFNLIKDVRSDVSLGYSANIYNLSYHELGSQTAFGLNAGVIAVLHQRTRLGFMLTNINKPQMGTLEKHEIPQTLAVGLSYIPYQGVITAFDIKKNWEGDTELRGGVEVEVHPMFLLRMGVRNNPASYSAGAGFKVIGVSLDYSISTHAVLDLTHHIGLGYKF